MQKKIEHILLGRDKQITPEETVKQPLPHRDFRFANPFIVLHHMGPEPIAAGGQLRIHPHPHRGFAPVTFQLQGEGYHKDNAGHDGIIRAGDVQWMFAGKGLLHSEGPTANLLQTGGTQELIQLWVNVPAAHKWDAPTYQQADKASLPNVLQQDGVSLRLASGGYEDKTGHINTLTPVISIVGEVAKGKRVQFMATPGYWTLLYIAHGSISVNCETVPEFNLLVFEKDNEEIIITAEEDTQLLYLSALPIDEPVAARDNFVMNTSAEIDQAMQDYKNGVFGELDR
jgi:redox-sensitive bicupin YhaK (pirin superfamily)